MSEGKSSFMASQSIIAKEVESLSLSLSLTAQILIKNRPNVEGLGEIDKINVLNTYLTHFFSTNDSILAILAHVAEIALVDPYNSAKAFISSLPTFTFSPDFKQPKGITYIATIKPKDLANIDVQYSLQLMNEILIATFMQLLISGISGQASQDKSYISKENQAMIQQLYQLLIQNAFSTNDITYITRVSMISAAYWSKALYSITPFVTEHAHHSLIAAMERTVSNHIMTSTYTLRIFSGFHPQRATQDQISNFIDKLKLVNKALRNNKNNYQFGETVCKFILTYICEVISIYPSTIDINTIYAPISKYISKSLSKYDVILSVPELEALRIYYSNESAKKVTQFIEKSLIPLINYPYRSRNFIRALTILLTGPNYNKDVSVDKNSQQKKASGKCEIPMDSIFSAFEKAISRGRYFDDTQTDLAIFIVQLANYDLNSFAQFRQNVISTQIFSLHNHLAFTMSTTMFLVHGSAFIADKQLFEIIDKSALEVIKRFIAKNKISLAPMNSELFLVQSLVSAIKTTQTPINQFLQFLPKVSHPMPPSADMISGRKIKVRWDRLGSRVIEHKLFDQYVPQPILASGYSSSSDMKKVEGQIGILNMAVFMNFVKTVASELPYFVLSSSNEIAAMAIHTLQALLYKQNQILFNLVKSTHNLVFLCPTIELAHLFRIVYTMEQIIDSAVYMKLKPDEDIAPYIVQIGVLGLCSSFSYIRSEAIKLFNLAEKIIGPEAFANFANNEELSTRKPSITAQKSYLLDFLSSEFYHFNEFAQSDYNNIYQFYLASYAASFTKYNRDTLSFLLKCLDLFEIASVDIVFLQNIIVFIVNMINPSNMDLINLSNFWASILRYKTDNQNFGVALYSFIHPCTISTFMKPLYGLLGPTSFRLSLLVAEYDDHYKLIPYVNQMLGAIFNKFEDDDPENMAMIYQLITGKTIFNRFYNEMTINTHSPFPCVKTVLPKMNYDSEGTSWYDTLPVIMNQGAPVWELCVDCYKAVLTVLQPSEESIERMLNNERITQSSMLSPLFRWAFDKNADKFLSLSETKPQFFGAFGGMFSHFGQPDAYFRDWNFSADGQPSGPFSEFIYKHVGDFIALSFFYLLEESFAGIRPQALDALAAVTLTTIAANDVKPAAEVFKQMSVLKRYLPPSLSVVLEQELEKTSSMLAKMMTFCSEQFIARAMKMAQKNQKMMQMIIPWLDDVSIKHGVEMVTTKTLPLFRCLRPLDMFKLICDAPQGSAVNKVISIITGKSQYAHDLFFAYLISLVEENSARAHQIVAFLLSKSPSLTIMSLSRFMTPPFFCIMDDTPRFRKITNFAVEALMDAPPSAVKSANECIVDIIAAASALGINASKLKEKFAEYYNVDIEYQILLKWARVHDSSVSSCALSLLGKHIEHTCPDNETHGYKYAAYEIKDGSNMTDEYLIPRLKTISASLSLISIGIPTPGQFWDAAAFLMFNDYRAEDIIESALAVVSKTFERQVNNLSIMQTFPGFLPLMLNSFITEKTRPGWENVILKADIKMLASESNAKYLKLFEIDDFPIHPKCISNRKSAVDILKDFDNTMKQHLVNFLSQYVQTTLNEPQHRETVLRLICSLIECSTGLDLTPFSALAMTMRSECMMGILPVHVRLLRDLSKVRLNLKEQEKVKKPFPLVITKDPGVRKFVDLDIDLQEKWSLVINTKEYEPAQTTIRLPFISANTIQKLSELVL